MNSRACRERGLLPKSQDIDNPITAREMTWRVRSMVRANAQPRAMFNMPPACRRKTSAVLPELSNSSFVLRHGASSRRRQNSACDRRLRTHRPAPHVARPVNRDGADVAAGCKVVRRFHPWLHFAVPGNERYAPVLSESAGRHGHSLHPMYIDRLVIAVTYKRQTTYVR